MTHIELYDTTLRDGMQGEGMSLSAQEKLRVAHRLDELGIDLIEAGFPSSNPKELELFDLLSRESFRHAQIAAFGMTRRRDARADADPGLRVLADSGAPVCTLVGKTWGLHLEKVVKVDREENLRMISESVAFLVAQGKRVVYDAEHFFDGFADDAAYALALPARRGRGRSRDGHLLRHQRRHAAGPDRRGDGAVVAGLAPLGARASGSTATTTPAAAWPTRSPRSSAAPTHVQGTMNGYGERCGNANLVTIIPNLQLKLGYDCLTDEQLASLTQAAHFSTSCSTSPPTPTSRTWGATRSPTRAACTSPASTSDPATFEHLDPDVVGNRREVLISELSGKGTVHARARDAGIALGDEPAAHLVERVKELEHRGYHFEAADGSFELLLRKETGEYEPLFRLESWRAIVEKRADGRVETEATIKIWVDGERYVRTAEGNGPVNALDRALRDALVEIHPHLRDIDLVNFKVRILDETKGTGAVTRVLLDASDGEQVWGSIGVSENVIEASWEALVDSLEYGMRVAGRPHERRGGVHRARDRRPRRSARRSRSRGRCWASPRRSGCSRCCARGGCRSDRCWASSSGRSPRASAPPTPARSRAARPGCISRSGRSASRTATR